MTTTIQSDFSDGVKAILPIQLGVIPFGLIAGVSAVSVGMSEMQGIGMSIVEFGENPARQHKHWFYLGTAVTLWLVWMAATAVSVFVGALIPESWSLNFAVPLTSMALLFATIKDKAMVLAAVAAGITAVIANSLPYKTGLILAAIMGIGVGMLGENIFRRQREER